MSFICEKTGGWVQISHEQYVYADIFSNRSGALCVRVLNEYRGNWSSSNGGSVWARFSGIVINFEDKRCTTYIGDGVMCRRHVAGENGYIEEEIRS